MNILNLPVGTIIEGHEILERLGDGFTGVVYRAQDVQKNRTVALKILKTPEKDPDIIIRRFKDEFRKQLIGKRHPNISEVYRFGSSKGYLFFTSEYIKEYNIFVGSRGMSVADKVKLFVQLLEGLDFIHRCGLLHLDIKAENVFLNGEPPSIKIIDFGMSALTGGDFYIGGTSHYIAPEVLRGDRNNIGSYSDLFSVAVLMYYCLTGAYPFPERWGIKELKDASKIIETEKLPKPPYALRKEIPEYLSAVIMRLLAKDPQERFYPNARAVLSALKTQDESSFGAGLLQSYLRPIGNKHIGRTEIQTALRSALAVIASQAKQSPVSSFFQITGNFGLGKTHLLEKLKDEATLSPENVYVSAISFPADELAIEAWTGELQRELSENSRSVLILADDIQNCDPEGKAGSVIQNIINAIAERKKSPNLYEGIKPVMLVMAGESFEANQNLLKENEIIPERYDWSKLTQNAGVVTWAFEPFNKSELLEYLKSTPALKDRDISEKWLEYLMWATSGFPADVVAQLEERDAEKMLFGMDGGLIVPYTIEPNMDEPSMNVTSLKWMPLPARDRLQKQYAKLDPLEQEVVNLLAVWDQRHLTRPITEEDVVNFFYSPAIKQTLNNLVGKSVIARPSHSVLVFTNPYMQAVVYDQLLQLDKEAIHDTIAGYLKNDADGILLHRGYGSGRVVVGGEATWQSPAISLIKLAQKGVRESGQLKRALSLLNDARPVTPVLHAYIKTLLVEYHTNSGNYSSAEKVFNDALAETEKTFFAGMRLWKIQLYRRVIPAIVQEHKFEMANQLIDTALKTIKPKDIINGVVIRNQHTRIYYERFFCEGGDVELLKEAKKEYETSRNLEAPICEINRSRILNNEAGYVSFSLGEYAQAVQELRQKFLRDKKEKNLFGEIATAVAIANTYQLLQDYKAAEEFAQYALKLAKNTRQAKWLFAGHQILADIYHDAGDLDSAINEGYKCVALSSSIQGVTESLIQLWITMADCYKDKEDPNKAILFIETALKSGSKGYHLMRAEMILGEIYHHKQDYKEATKHFDTAKQLLKTIPPVIAKKFNDVIAKYAMEADEPTIKNS